MAGDSLALAVPAGPDELEVDNEARGPDSSNLQPNDAVEAAVLVERRSSNTSGCLLLRRTEEEASAGGSCQGEQAVETVACFACS